MLAGKSRGRTPFCRTLKTVFSKSRIFCKASPLQLFHWNSCKIVVYCFRETRRGGLVRPASKSCRFSHHPLRVPKGWHGDFAACGQRSGLLALNFASIFEKLLDQKTFSLPAARNLQLISKLFFRIVFSNCFFNHRIRQATHLQPSDNWTEKEWP